MISSKPPQLANQNEDELHNITSSQDCNPNLQEQKNEIRESPIEYIQRCFTMRETEFNQEKVDVEGKQLRIKEKNRVEGKEMKRYQTYSEVYERIQTEDILDAFQEKQRLWDYVLNLESERRKDFIRDVYLSVKKK